MANCSPELNGQNLLLKRPYTLVARQKKKNQAGTELDTQLYRAERCYAHCWESHQSHLIVDPAFYNTARQDISIHLYKSGMTVIRVIDYFLNWI